jgi:site-specific DNA-methyltransferase (adenine-specific)
VANIPSKTLEILIGEISQRFVQLRGESNDRAALALGLGKVLFDLKTACGHGKFQQIVSARLPFSYSTASDFMKIARSGVKLGRKRARGSQSRKAPSSSYRARSIRQVLAYLEGRRKDTHLPPLKDTTRRKLATVISPQEPGEWECTLMYGDCLERLDDIDDRSVDLILADLPSGQSGLPWDVPLDLDCLWTQYKRIIRPNCPVVLFATQPYATDLIVSNREWYRYDWIWWKSHKTGFVHAMARPLREHENIVVFSEGTAISPVRSKRTMPYYPQVVPIPWEQRYLKSLGRRTGSAGYSENKPHNRLHAAEFTGYPGTVLYYPSDTLRLHPVAKPVALLRFLIETYTRPGNLVLDNTMGSGSCGVACVASGRQFIGIEQDMDFFDRAVQVISALNRGASLAPSSLHLGPAGNGAGADASQSH